MQVFLLKCKCILWVYLRYNCDCESFFVNVRAFVSLFEYKREGEHCESK